MTCSKKNIQIQNDLLKLENINIKLKIENKQLNIKILSIEDQYSKNLQHINNNKTTKKNSSCC